MSTRIPLGSIVVVALAVVAAGPARAAADGFAVVTSARSSSQTLSKADLRALYTGKTKQLDGNAVVVVVRGEDDAVFVAFVDQVFGIPTRSLLSKIKQEVFKGEMAKPIKAASDDEVAQAVGASPGTLGVVSSEAAGHLPKTVKVIAIGG
jgi:ABC-type phosphate transport system substrate-binding protein